jgi:hypothetical protein
VRTPPSIQIVVSLEGEARVFLYAKTAEDETRLRRVWNSRTDDLRNLDAVVRRLLNELDGPDREAA